MSNDFLEATLFNMLSLPITNDTLYQKNNHNNNNKINNSNNTNNTSNIHENIEELFKKLNLMNNN